MKIFDYYREIQKEAANDITKCTCHILKIKDNTPHPHCSGVFVKIDGLYFVLSAAHISDNSNNDFYVGTDDCYVKLGPTYISNVAIGARDDDKIDLLIIELNQEVIDKLGSNYEFLDQNELGINHNLQKLIMYTSVGFPSSKSKYNRYKKTLKSIPFIYLTMPTIKQQLYDDFNCKIDRNVIVHYDKNNVLNLSSGLTFTGPNLFGISGSGLWYTPKQIKSKGEKIEKKLVAIMTEWPIQNRKYMIGTRIDVFTEVIRQKYNLQIPHSKIINVNN